MRAYWLASFSFRLQSTQYYIPLSFFRGLSLSQPFTPVVRRFHKFKSVQSSETSFRYSINSPRAYTMASTGGPRATVAVISIGEMGLGISKLLVAYKYKVITNVSDRR